MKSRERSWMIIFGVFAIAIVAAGVVNHFANVIGQTADGADGEVMAQLYEHDHPHFGVAMMIGLAIVGVISFGLFLWLARRNKSGSVA